MLCFACVGGAGRRARSGKKSVEVLLSRTDVVDDVVDVTSLSALDVVEIKR